MVDISKWTIESMWEIVLDKQNLGLKYHREMMEIFTLLDMKSYAEWQRYRLNDESEEAFKFKTAYIRKFRKIYKAQEMKETLLQNSFVNSNKYSIDNKRAIIDEVFSAWVEWEKSVSDLYMGCIQWCILNQNSDYLIFEKMLKGVHQEQEHLNYHYSKLQDSKYNMSDILEWQEYIYNKYKDKK